MADLGGGGGGKSPPLKIFWGNFGEIWGNIREIWEKFGKFCGNWENLVKIKHHGCTIWQILRKLEKFGDKVKYYGCAIWEILGKLGAFLENFRKK